MTHAENIASHRRAALRLARANPTTRLSELLRAGHMERADLAKGAGLTCPPENPSTGELVAFSQAIANFGAQAARIAELRAGHDNAGTWKTEIPFRA